jgi:hypothetical protein
MPIQFQRWTNETEYLELAADLDIGQTSMTVTDGSKLYQITGQEYQFLSLGPSDTGEIIYVYEVAGNVCAITRAQEGTTEQDWPAGTMVQCRLTAGSLNSLAQAIGENIDDIAALQALPDFAVVDEGADQTIPDDTDTAVSFSHVIYDSNTLYDENEPTRLTGARTGTYWAHGSAEYAADADGYRQLAIVKGGSTVEALARIPSPRRFAYPLRVQVGSYIYLAQGDYVELIARHTAGAALDILAANGGPRFGMHLVRTHGAIGGGT